MRGYELVQHALSATVDFFLSGSLDLGPIGELGSAMLGKLRSDNAWIAF